MRVESIKGVGFALAICAIVPLSSIAEPAPKAGDYKMLPVSEAGQMTLMCHRYIVGTVDGRPHGIWSPILVNGARYCTPQQTVVNSNIRRLPAVPHGKKGDSIEYCSSETRTVHFVVYSKVGGKIYDNPFDFNGNQNTPCVPILESSQRRKK